MKLYYNNVELHDHESNCVTLEETNIQEVIKEDELNNVFIHIFRGLQINLEGLKIVTGNLGNVVLSQFISMMITFIKKKEKKSMMISFTKSFFAFKRQLNLPYIKSMLYLESTGLGTLSTRKEYLTIAEFG